jgi:hypothetical protein
MTRVMRARAAYLVKVGWIEGAFRHDERRTRRRLTRPRAANITRLPSQSVSIPIGRRASEPSSTGMATRSAVD